MYKAFLLIYFLLFLSAAHAQDIIIVTDTLESIPLAIEGPGYECINPIDIEPQFPGGDSALFAFIKMNLEYPPECVQGIVYVKFRITEFGEIDSIHVIRGINEEMDSAAVNLIRSMPNWTPRIYVVSQISVGYTLPIRFELVRN